MKTMIQKLTLIAIGTTLSMGALAQNVAVVNGKAIPSGMLDYIMEEQAKRGAPATDEMRTTIRQELINQEVLRQEAIKKGLAETKAVKYQMEMVNHAILSNALRDDFLANTKPTDDEIKATYDSLAKMIQGSEYRSSHILVETEEEAKKIIGQLDGGADFGKLAEANSKDPGSAKNGGDLDWANPQSFVPEFAEAMVKLEKGKYTKSPVKSQFGYHIILLTDTRENAAPPLDQVKDQISERIINQKWEEYQAALMKKAKVQ